MDFKETVLKQQAESKFNIELINGFFINIKIYCCEKQKHVALYIFLRKTLYMTYYNIKATML